MPLLLVVFITFIYEKMPKSSKKDKFANFVFRIRSHSALRAEANERVPGTYTVKSHSRLQAHVWSLSGSASNAVLHGVQCPTTVRSNRCTITVFSNKKKNESYRETASLYASLGTKYPFALTHSNIFRVQI